MVREGKVGGGREEGVVGMGRREVVILRLRREVSVGSKVGVLVMEVAARAIVLGMVLGRPEGKVSHANSWRHSQNICESPK